MPAASAPFPLAAATARLPAVIMIGAAVNALVVSVMAGLGPEAAPSITFGVNPFQLVAVGVAARLSLGDGEAARRHSPWLDALAVALVLVPSSAIAWLALAIYAAVQATQTTSERRAGALIFLALAIASLWSSVVLKWIALPVTSAEAFMVAKALAPFRPDIVQIANVVGDQATHNLIIMTKCTTADALPQSAVALAAVALLLGPVSPRRLLNACIALGALYAVANLARLAAMAWSADYYALVHGPIGANIFDLFQVVAVLALAASASRP
ncbi:MAG: hypothetical protein JNM89_11410 [Hyphomicrobiaceae bacterium]|nr:hypothetical protein [Hyphomicrobiaceae bacterium]